MKCTTCYGFGLWAWGDTVPMGSLDAEDGFPTLPCPACGANANPVELLRDERDEEVEEDNNG